MDQSWRTEEALYEEFALWEDIREAPEVSLELRDVTVLSTSAVLSLEIGELKQKFLLRTPAGYPNYQVIGVEVV